MILNEEDRAVFESLLRLGAEVGPAPLGTVQENGETMLTVGGIAIGTLSVPTNGHPPGTYLFEGTNLLDKLQTCGTWTQVKRTVTSELHVRFKLDAV